MMFISIKLLQTLTSVSINVLSNILCVNQDFDSLTKQKHSFDSLIMRLPQLTFCSSVFSRAS